MTMTMTKTVNSVCSYCGTGCGISLTTDGQRIIQLQGNPLHPTNQGMLCSKGRALHHTVDTEDRLLQPQLRTTRTAPFAPVDWGTALDYGATKFANIIKEHGADAVAFYVSGQLLTEDYYVFNKLMKGFIGSNNIDTNSRLCMSSAVAGYKRAFGADGPPICYDDIELAESYFIIGANPAYAHPILFRRMEAAKEANPNLKIIVADPRRTDTCSIADIHLPLKPGTDVPLLQAMLNVMVWEDMIDHDYIAAHTQGFDRILARIKTMTPRKAANICGVNAMAIIQAAMWFAEYKTLSFWTMGMNQSTSGTDKNNALLNLHLATGQIGKAGCGPFSLTGQANAMGGREVGGMATMLAAHRDYNNAAHRKEVADYWGVKNVAQSAGLTATELFTALETGRVKAVWIVCTNPMVSMPDGSSIEAALQKAEWVMVSDAYHPTDTTRLAHLLLPAAGWAEKEGTMTNSERLITHIEQAIPAAGASRPDWKIAADFARVLGDKLGKSWQQAFDYSCSEEVFNEHRGLTQGTTIDMTGLSYALLDEQGPQQWPYPEGGVADGANKRLYQDGCFNTANHQANFIDVCYRPVAEATDAAYPLSLTTGRIRDQWHSMTKTGHVPELMQHMPIPALQIHPDDAKQRGIDDDCLVNVVSRRGIIRVAVYISADVSSGVVFLPMHWGKMTARSGHSNTIIPSFVDPISKEPEFKHAAVQVARFEAAWRGRMLIAGKAIKSGQTMIEGYTYGVVTCSGIDHPVTSIELACTQPLQDAQYQRLDHILEQGKCFETLTYSDRKHGINRKAWLENNRLVAVRWVGGNIHDAQWLQKLMLEDRDITSLRPYLLSPTSPIDKQDTKGKIICACHNVGALELNAAIKEGANTLAQLKTCTQAGTGCGSCMPEMKRLLAN